MGESERLSFERDWKSWAHDGQHWPEGAWRTWVIKAGRGFGKTLAGAHWVTAAVATREKLSIALVGATLAEARKVMVEGRSGLLHVAADWVTDWSPSLRRLRFRTGAEATLFSGHSPEILRGPEHHIAWCDELAKWEEAQASWDMLQFGLRLGDWPRALVTTTPRPGPVLKSIMEDPETIVTGGPTSRNPHVSAAWKRGAYARYAGTRLGRQELEAELLPDAPGALWSVELLEKCRAGTGGAGVPQGSARPEPVEGLSFPYRETAKQGRASTMMGPPSHCPGDSAAPSSARTDEAGSLPGPNGGGVTSPGSHFGSAAITWVRVVIAVDPPAGDGTCGIIACAKDSEGRAHVLADHSVTARTPEGWARAVASAARIHSSPSSLGEGDRRYGGGGAGAAGTAIPVQIVAEKNQGGRMVEAVLRTADPDLRVKSVTATVGKSERAEPVAMLFEAGRVVLHGRFPELEAELLGMIAGGGYEGPGVSPDRADAMVWGLTELLLTPERTEPRVRRL
jgi:phage terminase large subunit-like protein